MKKFFLLFAAAIMTAGVMSAQDINKALEIYNNGAMELQMGNKEGALNLFLEALAMAETLGEDGAELAGNCKGTIPALNYEIAKDMIEAKSYDEAVAQLNKTVEVAGLYEDPSTAEKAKDMLPKVYLSKGNDLFKAKDAAGALAAYEQSVALDSTNAMATLQLGRTYLAVNKPEEAEKALYMAARHGREGEAMKQLSNYWLKKAQASGKAGKSQEVIDFAKKANSYLENANAYRLAAGAAQKLGKNADCIAYYEKYLELKPNAKDAGGVQFTIAALYQQGGNKEKAREYYQKASTDPQYGPQAQEQLKNL